MNSSRTTPLHIFEVLEEEFLALHGTPYQEIQVKLADPDAENGFRMVTATRTWNFYESHIKSSATLANELLPQNEDSKGGMGSYEANPDSWAKKHLKAYIWGKLDPATQTALTQAQESSSFTPILVKILNDLLTDSALFSEERFSIYWLSD